VIPDALLAEAVADTGVRRLLHAYADVVNRRAWSEMAGLFRDDAPVVVDRRVGEPRQLVGGAAVGAFIEAAIDRFEFFEFVVLNAHVAFPDGPEAGTAASRLFMCEIRQDRDGGRWTTAYGVYHDRCVLDGRRWRFAERRYHSLARHGPVLDVFPFPHDAGLAVPGPGTDPD
jgi:SnoaL-like domain